jgi:oxygen-dependent protoporphyrinogen oxidase
LLYDGLILATPAHAAAKLLEGVDAPLAADLRGIPYAGCAIVLIGYWREQIAHALDGFGFVVPQIENRRILAASISSNKFPGRAPERCVLLRVFVGGARHPELVEHSEEQLRTIVLDELRAILSTQGEPLLFRVIRWRNAMPQYHVGHTELVKRIEARAAALSGLALAGNAYHGVGIPDCIHSGELAAEALCRSKRHEVQSEGAVDEPA